MTPEAMGRLAKDLFDQGYHCSQAVFSAAMEKLGAQHTEGIIRSLSPFGGGIASTGNICGTILGALAVIGFIQGKSKPKERDGRSMWRMSYKLFKAFQELTAQYGGPKCCDIARVNWKDAKAVKAFRNDPSSRRKECFYVIEQTAIILANMLDDMDKAHK